MKKLIAVIVVVLFVTVSAFSATKEFVQKPVDTDSGFPASCWVVTGIWLDLKANCGVITLEGYKDFESKEAGKQVMGTKTVNIPDLTVLSCYTVVRTVIIQAVFAAESFTGATLETREVAEPVIVNP
ncbi:MAG: hypothetical protein WC071_09520 [Victivallaceae bacterium]